MAYTHAIQGPTATNLKSTATVVPTFQYVPAQPVAVPVQVPVLPVVAPMVMAAVCYPCQEIKETKTVGLAGVMFGVSIMSYFQHDELPFGCASPAC
ncbi:hypothetical protein KEM54_006445 [Ascosphaera aggregata]|nr:hypothetical protein KEM54_006445 [Ascosphaera aggregata]